MINNVEEKWFKVSYKGWMILVVIIILLFYGGIFIIRMTPFFNDPEVACYDVENEGIPKFLDAHFTEMDKIEYIKRFRSAYGMEFSDDLEECRIMKHTFIPFEEYWLDKEVKVYSPVNGTITSIGYSFLNSSGTWNEYQSNIATIIKIQPSEYKAFTIIIKFVDIRDMGLYHGLQVSAGQHIGYACLRYVNKVTKLPAFNIAVEVNMCPSGTKMLSYFDIITDYVFQYYKDHGANSREDFIISKEERDKDPLICVFDHEVGYCIYDKGNIPNWVYLGNSPSDFKIVYDYS